MENAVLNQENNEQEGKFMFRCADAVAAMIEVIGEEHAPQWKPMENWEPILEQYCQVFDVYMTRFDSHTFSCEIDENTLEIELSFECDEAQFDGGDELLIRLIENCCFFRILKSEEGQICLQFRFPGIWTKEVA